MAALDNAMDEVPGEALNGLRKLCPGTKPIILLMHIPMTVETLTQPTKNVWGRDICMGPGGVGYWIDTVYGLYQLVAVRRHPSWRWSRGTCISATRTRCPTAYRRS